MSRNTWDLDYGPLNGLYRDRENGWIFGVCAGLADRFNFRTATVRVIAIICLVLFFWLINCPILILLLIRITKSRRWIFRIIL